MTETHISADMRAAVGSQIGRIVSHPVASSDIRRWALAVYWPEPPPERFLGDGNGLIAPEEFNPFAWAVARTESLPRDTGGEHDPDAVEHQLGIEGPGLVRMLNGGIHVEYGAPIVPGDVITSTSRLGPYSERSGRHGLMLFSTTEDAWTNQSGAVVRRTVNTLIRY